MSRRETESEHGLVTETQKKVKRPPLYKVLLHNDDYTTKEFVVQILQYVFHKEQTEAVQIMLHVHKKGIGVAGVYTYEIAETKVALVEDLARQHEYPLKCTMEEAYDDQHRARRNAECRALRSESAEPRVRQLGASVIRAAQGQGRQSDD